MHPQAIILQGQVKAQAEKDVANYEAEWRQLTDMVEADRRAREAQRQKEIAVREAQMAALFRQSTPPPSKQRRSTLRAQGSCGAGAAAAGGAAPEKAAAADGGDTALASTDRVRQLKEELAKVLEATGGCSLQSPCLPAGHARRIATRHAHLPCSPPPPPAPPAGAADVDELLQALVAAEEANFSLFNYVNDLGGEVDKLEEGIGSLRSAALAWSMLPYWIVQRVVP